jgi:uncharacterized protein (DUF362 family)
LIDEIQRCRPSNIIVGETPTYAAAVQTEGWCKYQILAKKKGIKFLNLLDTPYVEVNVKDPIFFKKVRIPKLLKDCDVLIDVPTLKTHCQCGITLSFKNYYGFLSRKDRAYYHKTNRVEEIIVDLYRSRKADLIIVDGTYTTFHIGPRPLQDYHENSRLDISLGGTDPVSVDTIGAKILEIDPCKLRYLKWAEMKELGTSNLKKIKVVGSLFNEKNQYNSIDVVKYVNARSSNIKILDYGACTGCLSLSISLFKNLKIEEQSKKTVFIMGPKATYNNVKEHITKKEKIVLCGNCASPTFYNNLKGRFVVGCPPSSKALIEETKKIAQTKKNI